MAISAGRSKRSNNFANFGICVPFIIDCWLERKFRMAQTQRKLAAQNLEMWLYVLAFCCCAIIIKKIAFQFQNHLFADFLSFWLRIFFGRLRKALRELFFHEIQIEKLPLDAQLRELFAQQLIQLFYFV